MLNVDNVCLFYFRAKTGKGIRNDCRGSRNQYDPLHSSLGHLRQS